MSARSRVSRRRFLTLVAGSAALLSSGSLAAQSAKPAAKKRAARPSPQPKPDPLAKWSEEAAASTKASLEVLRKHPLPPGGDLSLVFMPIARSRRTR